MAPGWPGIPPRWTSSAKSGVGTSIRAESRVWFTISHGILNEVYYPRVDQACTRDLGLIVTDGIEKAIIADPRRDVVFQRTSFVTLQRGGSANHLNALLASHLANFGSGNTAWCGEYKGIPMLFAERSGFALRGVSPTWVMDGRGFFGNHGVCRGLEGSIFRSTTTRHRSYTDRIASVAALTGGTSCNRFSERNAS